MFSHFSIQYSQTYNLKPGVDIILFNLIRENTPDIIYLSLINPNDFKIIQLIAFKINSRDEMTSLKISKSYMKDCQQIIHFN